MTTTTISLTRISSPEAPPARNTVAVALAGELDVYTVARIEPTLTHLTRNAQAELTLDLTDITFCDSSGAALLLRVHERSQAAGVRLRLSGIQRLPARVIRALGVDRALSCSFA
ncbi:STAS domain-containing protein [Streptomyces vietnamensis]|uniref:STAS domain-containing protein n=1 Tax=Streptomyces vietnamensis TaxID=362257 RepID=UPI0037AB9194